MTITIKYKIVFAILFFFLSSLGTLLIVGQSVKEDFIDYTEGEREDTIYVLTAFLESQYEKKNTFDKESACDIALVALSMGYEISLFDAKGTLVCDTLDAVKNIKPLARRRYASHIKLYENYIRSKNKEDFTPYSLFLKNEEIGVLNLRQFEKKRSLFFIERSEQFLLWGIILAFISSALLGLFITSKILYPLSRLRRAAIDISMGKKVKPIEVSQKDELGEVAIAFNKMSKSLVEREQARKTSTAKFAHELRTPLAVMQSELEAMIDGVLKIDETRIQSLLEEVLRLKKMIEGLERLYKIEKEAISLDIKEVSLKNFLEIMRERFLLKARVANNDIIVDCEDISVYTAPNLLTQLIYNLVDNALNATKNGTVTIKAKKEGKLLKIDVIDSGIGIEEKDLPFIFERFFSKKEGGLGIGLAVVKEIVDLMGGEIKVASNVGKGTVVTVYLKEMSL